MREPVIGIDLGTTYSAVAVMEEGRPRIIPKRAGLRLTPSMLADGIRFWNGVIWETVAGTEALPLAGCPDEDTPNRNGVLDPGEDLNTNGRIEAGNIARRNEHLHVR